MIFTVVDLSRWQFAVTAMYHFLFVPLTLGLVLILAVMETIYVVSGQEVWKRITQFWGLLFGLNFAMGVATGLTMEFQFGTNWAFFTHYVGDIFGSPLAIEGLMAFFLEATFVGMFFFGWKRLTKKEHLMVTWLVFLGSNFSALWILIANGWMQHPVGAHFNPQTLRMELSSFYTVLFNDEAQVTFLHTLSAAYTLGSMFVLGISSYYLLRKRHTAFAKRSALVASIIGLFAIVMTIFVGDKNGYYVAKDQPSKIAAIEAIWGPESAPAPLKLIAFPSESNHQNYFVIQIPFLLGIIATESLNQPIVGIDQIQQQARQRFQTTAIVAYQKFQNLINRVDDPTAGAYINNHLEDLGYGLLLSLYAKNPTKPTPTELQTAAHAVYPNVASMFWLFRLMVGLGFYFLIIFLIWVFITVRRRNKSHRILWFITMLSIPLPWVAIESGWFIQEYGRQPWLIFHYLPTASGVSTLSLFQISLSLALFVILYSTLLIVDLYLMVKYARKGPGHYLEDLPREYQE